MEYQVQFIDSFLSAFSKFAEENFYLSGLTNVFDEPEFTNVKRVKQFVDMLDRRELIKLIGKNERLTVKFASDIEVMPLANTTVISIPYRISETEHGTIAVLGPTRMEYSRVIPLLEYIASNIGKLYKK